MPSVSLARTHRRSLLCQATASPKRVLIVGGTGRVGSSAALALLKTLPDVEITLAGRQRAHYDALISKELLQKTEFAALDTEDATRLRDAVGAADLVVHSAGPFQQREQCEVLEAAIEMGTAYLDVCDDVRTTQLAKQLHPVAVERGVPAIVGGGSYPGLSNVMAAHIISSNRQEYDADGYYQEPSLEADVAAVNRIRYSYFTAGSGGTGETLLTTSLMLLGEDVIAFKDNRQVAAAPMSQPVTVDFGPGMGRKGVFLLNLPETVSAHEVLGAANASARFGTSPAFWNWLLWAMARLVAPAVFQDRGAVRKLAAASLPIVRFVDPFVGEAVGMRVDVEFGGGKSAAGVYVHSKFSESIGTCVSAFAQCLLEAETSPGVWLPDEKGAMTNRRAFLERAAEGCQKLILNRPPWQIESDPTRIGLGLYVY